MKEIIFAGFGGQGVLTGGLVIAEMATKSGLSAVWMPAYGPTMRGGKANCVVKYGEMPEEKIGSPVMEYADVLVAMNVPALDYLEFCKPDCTVFANAHNVPEDQQYPAGVKVVRLDCAELAEKAENPKGQSLVMVGAIIKHLGWFDGAFARDSLMDFYVNKGKEKFAQANVRAFDVGYEEVK